MRRRLINSREHEPMTSGEIQKEIFAADEDLYLKWRYLKSEVWSQYVSHMFKTTSGVPVEPLIKKKQFMEDLRFVVQHFESKEEAAIFLTSMGFAFEDLK